MNKFKLYTTDQYLLEEATELVNYTGCIEIENNIVYEELYLRLDDKGLAIICKDFSPLYISGIYSNLKKRTQSLSKELLIQSIKTLPSDNTLIIDATAGLAKDSAILGLYGYKVQMIEYHPVLATIIYYALKHGYLPKDNLTLIYANSVDYLGAYTGVKPSAIYLDPMFKEGKSSAKSKKEMQIIQKLTEDNLLLSDPELDQRLFSLAYSLSHKTIVKRDNKQQSIVSTPKPTYFKHGKIIRYDVYIH